VFGLISQYRSQVYDAFGTVPKERILEVVDALLRVHRRQGNVFVLCPPEDSADRSPCAYELAQGIGAGPFDFRVVRLYGAPGDIVSWQNDWAYEDIYAEQLRGRVGHGDALIAISRQGRALGMARALHAARRAGATAIAIVGFAGGALKDEADICLHVRSDQADRVEDVQTMLVHTLCVALRRLLSPAPDGRSPSSEVAGAVP